MNLDEVELKMMKAIDKTKHIYLVKDIYFLAVIK